MKDTKNCLFVAKFHEVQNLSASFLVDGPFLCSTFDQSNRALQGLPTAAATLPQAATTLQCTAYLTDGKYLGLIFCLTPLGQFSLGVE